MRSSALLVALFVLVSQSAFGQGEIINKTLTHDGVRRSYILYVPPGYSAEQPTPLVLNFHGGMGNGNEQMITSAMNAVAEQEGFLVAYPNAVNGDWSLGNDHNISFTDSLLDAIGVEYSVDSARVYATGKSQGGAMSYVLGAARPNIFAAVASVASPRFNSGQPNRFPPFVPNTPNRPMPLLHIHGTSDPIVPYRGGNLGIPGLEFITFPSVSSVIGEWAANNGCGDIGPEMAVDDISPTDDSTVSIFSYQNCATYVGVSGTELTAEVVHYRVNDAGHSWPVFQADREESLAVTAAALGDAAVLAFLPMNSDISASAEIWSFFEQHELPASAIPEPSGLSLSWFAVLAMMQFLRRSNRFLT